MNPDMLLAESFFDEEFGSGIACQEATKVECYSSLNVDYCSHIYLQSKWNVYLLIRLLSTADELFPRAADSAP